MKGEISHYCDEINPGIFQKSNMKSKNDNIRDDYKEDVSSMLALVEKRKNHLEEAVRRRRFEEFWAENQTLKADLEAERETLKEQIEALNREILTIPEKTEGYNEMLLKQKKIQRLTFEKESLGFFKINDKKAVQRRIDSTNNEIAPIQARINSAIEMVQKKIFPLENRINAIDIELTKPR